MMKLFLMYISNITRILILQTINVNLYENKEVI